MIRVTDLRLPLEHPEPALRQALLQRLGLTDATLDTVTVFRRGHDARHPARIELIYTLDVQLAGGEAAERELLTRLHDDPHVRSAPDTRYRLIGHAPADFAASGRPRPLVIGFGPCGLFAALVLAQMGLCPIVLERGRAVRQRTQDTWGLWRRSVLDPTSNVQFGEGGAGTFSDGKLWSQISDPRHLTRKVLTEFVKAGAPEEILYVSKPHIGTFRLVSMIEKMRAEIVRLGGEIRFEAQVVDLHLEPVAENAGQGGTGSGTGSGPGSRLARGHPPSRHAAGSSAAHGDGARARVAGVTLASGESIQADHIVLCPGHSARDTFAMLHERGVFLEAKPFSIGFRIEHPQGMIDRARFGAHAGHPLLGAADYKLVHHAKNGRSVYSFCMCPGGTVVAATSEPGRVVTNGMSQYSRAERNANAGIVVGITPEDYRQPHPDQAPGSPVNPLDGIAFQRAWESRAYALGGGDYLAPGQLVGDFLRGQRSATLGEVEPSYKPGVRLTDLSGTAERDQPSLPAYAIEALREAIPAFGRRIRGFDRRDGVFTGVETRTSSPLRITRGRDRQSLNVVGLYPAGEGAGYAGGIMSAGVDGIETAEAVARSMLGLADVPH